MNFVADFRELIESDSSGLLAAHPSWERVTLGSIANVVNGFAFESKYFHAADGVPLIRIRDVVRGRTETKFRGPVPDGYWVCPGDLIVGMDGDFNCAVWSGPRALLNQRVCRISIVSRYFEPRLLRYVLGGYLSAINRHTSSITVKHLSSKTLAAIPLPLPPLSEQRRIVESLDALLGRAAASREHLDRVPDILRRFRRSVLAAATSGELTRDWRRIRKRSPWTEGTLGRYVELKTGPFGSSLHKSDYSARGTPIVNPMHIVDGRIVPTDSARVNGTVLNRLKEFQLREGDVVLGRRGEMGRCAVVTSREAGWLCGTGSVVLRPAPGLSAEFLALFLAAPSTVDRLEAHAVGSTMVNLNQKIVKDLRLELPLKDEQNEIVRRVNGLTTAVDAVNLRARRVIDQTSDLLPSILAKAFRGELVPQDPNDEPASELLARIRREKQQTDEAGLLKASKVSKQPKQRRSG